MRILHLIPFLWSGAGDVVSRLAVSQAARHEVAVVTSGTSRGLADWPRYRRRLRRAGVAIHRIDLFDRAPAVFWHSQARLSALVDAWQPRVLHAHAGVPTCAAVLASRIGRRARVVAQFYNWGPDRPAWMDAMDLGGYRAADLVVCSARHYHGKLTRAGMDVARLRMIPWGLDDRWFDAPPSHGQRPGATPVIGFVGRLEPRKGQLDLVRAFARLRRHVPAARLELVGPPADTAYADAIAATIAKEGLSDSVSLLGEVRDVRPYLQRWSAFVSLSADEGQGMAVLEAMASDVPVVARQVPGIEDVLDDGITGYAVSDRHPARIAAVIRRCLEDERGRRAITRAARLQARRAFRWTHTIHAMEAAYRAAGAAEGRR